jgi:hypothetical protein
VVIIYLGCKLPYTSSDLPEDSAGHHSSSYLVLLRVGFTKLISHLTTGRLLPCLFTFTEYSKLSARLCIFCSTFLKVTLTGGYPALCPVELGLSSEEIPFLPRLPDLLIKYSFFSILKYHFNTIKSINLKESIEYIVSSIALRKRKSFAFKKLNQHITVKKKEDKKTKAINILFFV